jgi:hypothetical protein
MMRVGGVLSELLRPSRVLNSKPDFSGRADGTGRKDEGGSWGDSVLLLVRDCPVRASPVCARPSGFVFAFRLCVFALPLWPFVFPCRPRGLCTNDGEEALARALDAHCIALHGHACIPSPGFKSTTNQRSKSVQKCDGKGEDEALQRPDAKDFVAAEFARMCCFTAFWMHPPPSSSR